MQHHTLIGTEQLFNMMDASNDLFILYDWEGNIHKMNRAYLQLLRQETQLLTWSELLPYIHSEDLQTTQSAFNKWRTTSVMENFVNRYMVGDECHWIQWSVVPQQEYRWICAIGHNITERKKLEEHLIASNKKFSIAFHNSPTINFIVHLQTGMIMDANNNFLKYFSKVPQFELQTLSIFELEQYGSRPLLMSHIQQIQERGYIHNEEIAFTCSNGLTGYFLFSGEKVLIENEEYALSIMTDITDKKNNDKQMSLLDKYDLLGSMAASIAHEVRNPMTTVKGFLQLLRNKPEFYAHRDTFTLMVEELDRANSIISEYLSLATPSDGQYSQETKSLNQIINYLLPLLEADILRNNLKLEVILGTLTTFQMNENEIRQLILNLCRNAIEAMIDGGILTISTYMEAEQVVLEVSDQGSGIPEEIIDSIFNPFFTTKDTGTGIGLVVCRIIADHHDAEINVDSSPNGTTFYIRFKT
ncbi:MAG: signal transduction histidine kinase, nitrogen specific [Paenibacillus sp.]|jgi:PAS domain S-box-containing protein|nr:signal transduction histidine kinase, nitrogen specific [Paenibacillus sp.]